VPNAAVPRTDFPGCRPGCAATQLNHSHSLSAAVVGGVVAPSGDAGRGRARDGAGSRAWEQLFLIYDLLPATIRPGGGAAGAEAWRRRTAAVWPPGGETAHTAATVTGRQPPG
jgi:hypothetical protein